MRVSWLAFFCAGCLLAVEPYPRRWFLNAHNCYPDRGRGADRFERARQAGLSAFELDLVWSEPLGRTVISHERKLTGQEPALDSHFARFLLPELRQLPPEQPGLLLLLDFKTDHPGPPGEVRSLLLRYRDLVTANGARGDAPTSTPLRYRPLTVLLTGHAAAIARYEAAVADGEPFLAMGNREPAERRFREEIAEYFPQPATVFYRVFNFQWIHIEREPNSKAGAFTAAEESRLRSLVETARQEGYWLRAWNLNATSRAWSEEHNFGGPAALLERWRAALEAGVDMVATDEYDLAGRFTRTAAARPRKARSTR